MEDSYEDSPEPQRAKMLSDIKIFSADNEYRDFLRGLIAEKYIGIHPSMLRPHHVLETIKLDFYFTEATKIIFRRRDEKVDSTLKEL